MRTMGPYLSLTSILASRQVRYLESCAGSNCMVRYLDRWNSVESPECTLSEMTIIVVTNFRLLKVPVNSDESKDYSFDNQCEPCLLYTSDAADE